MSTLHLPAPARASHGAASTLRQFGTAWSGLMRRWAQNQPPCSRSAEEEARKVREMAVDVQRTDPRFAAELFAAADRHERLYG